MPHGALSDTKLISIPFVMRVTEEPFIRQWSGTNAALAASLFLTKSLPWPIRMSIKGLSGCVLTVGEQKHASVNPSTDSSVYIPPIQSFDLSEISIGASIHGEILMEPVEGHPAMSKL